jgi:8-oxo-dGTP pyrophosphatase MutT (NUDIX family)
MKETSVRKVITGLQGKYNAAFCAFLMRENENFDLFIEAKGTRMKPPYSTVMCYRYSDHTFGFPGGYIEKNEDWLAALKREVLEEIGVDISDFPKPKLICSHCLTPPNNKPINVHLYAIEVSSEMKSHIFANTGDSKHFMKEICGLVVVLLNIDFLKDFFDHPIVSSGKEEIYDLINEMNLVCEDALQQIKELLKPNYCSTH